MQVDKVFDEADEEISDKNDANDTNTNFTTAPVAAASVDTSATALDESTATIQSDLEHVEESLAREGQRRGGVIGGGRAAFDSVSSTLTSLRRRITNSLRESSNSNRNAHENDTQVDPSVASTAAFTTSSTSTTTENDGRSTTTMETQLVRRLERAELAHSMGIPLPMLHNEMQRRRQEQYQQQNVAAQKSEGKSSEDEDNKMDENFQDESPSRMRRASSLVASRTSVRNLRQQAVETELHDAGNDIVLPRIIDASDKNQEELDNSNTSDMNNTQGQELWTESYEDLNDITMTTETAQQPQHPKSVLYSWGVSRNNDNNNNNSNAEDAFPQSLHDDEQIRSLTTSRVDATGRLGRYTITALHAGPKHSAVVTATGEVLLSGGNESGQVDPYRRDDTYIPKPSIMESINMARIRQVACGRSHTAALVANTGQVLTWGSNAVGQLGRGPTPTGEPTTFCRPAAIILGPGVRASTVACGHDFTAVLTTRMRLLVCGSRDVVAWDESAGPHAAKPRYPSGLPVLEGLPLVQMSAGARHVAVITQGGMVYAWGNNTSGCCGRESPQAIHVPVSMLLPETQRALPALPPPAQHKEASKRHDYGQSRKQQQQQQQQTKLGSASMVQWNSWNGPDAQVCLPDDVRIVHAACGVATTVLLTRSGSARVFGSHSSREVAFQSKRVDAPQGRKFVDAAAGDSYTLLLDDTGDVWCLRGDFETVQLELVLKGQGIVALTASGRHAAALAHRMVAPPTAGGATTMPPSIQREISTTSTCDDSTTRLVKDPSLLVTVVSTLVPLSKNDATARSRLVIGTEEFFKSPAVWNSLFYNPNDCRDLYATLLLLPEDDSGEKSLVLVSSLRQEIATAMERSMLKGLDLLRSDGVRMIYPESVRVLWFYLQNPLFPSWNTCDLKFDNRGDVILALCDTMLSLPFEGYKSLMSWATLQYDRKQFCEYLIHPLIAQFERGWIDSAGARYRAVPGIVAVLKWLVHAAEQSGIAEPEDFYSQALASMDPQVLYQDLQSFKAASPEAKKSSFFVCANPFLLSPMAKRNLLQVEHQVDMLKAATSQVTWDMERRQYMFDPFFVLAIDRQYLLQQTLHKISNASPTDLRKSLKVVFKGEDGVDAGGVTKEFFQLLSQELLDMSTGMWCNDNDDTRITWFNGDCTWNFDGYYLVGVLVGMALYNSVLIDVPFPKVVYRKLLGRSLGLEDMVDEEIKNGLQALLDYDDDNVQDVFCLNFEVAWSSLGVEKRIELKPGGAEIPVTSTNKEEYVLLYVKWLLVDSIAKQWETFENGVMHVLDGSSLDLLTPNELERLVVGTTHLDFEALRRCTEYEGGYSEQSPVVQNFWKFCCCEADDETRLKLLKFATGSPKAPIGGLGAMGFKVQRAGPDSLQLPTSHTCFNTLLLPDYGENYDKLSRLLGRAILECEGFGLQ